MSFGLMFHLLKIWRNQWLTKQELEELQQRKLQKIIKHAYERVRYYRQLFDSVGIRPEDIRSKKDLQYIPVTSREQIQRVPINEIAAKGIKLGDCHRMRTSGSTGIPLEVIKSEKEYQLSNLVMMRSFLANGYRLTDKQVVIITPRDPRTYWFQYLGLMRQNCISAFDNAASQIKQLRQVSPDFIWGLSSSLGRIAEEVRKRDIEDISPRGVATGGEILNEKTRQAIQSTFRSQVFDFYSSQECGNIAWECDRHEGYHINIDSLVVEIVNNGKSARPGEKGEVLITGLDSYAMPFIRYRMKDIGVGGKESCSCGRGLPLLKRVEGRADDLVVLSDGTLISPAELVCALGSVPGVLGFKVLQKEIDQFVLQLKIERNCTGGTVIKKVRQEMTRILGHQSHIEIQIVGEIPRDSSGKMRSVVSNIKASFSKNA